MTTAILFKTILSVTGINKSQLAEKIGKHPSRISEWLRGREISFKDAFKICETLDLDLYELIKSNPND